jgi:hypothetical protein
MLKRGAGREEVGRYLREMRILHMGIGEPEDRGNEVEIVEILINWREAIFDE